MSDRVWVMTVVSQTNQGSQRLLSSGQKVSKYINEFNIYRQDRNSASRHVVKHLSCVSLKVACCFRRNPTYMSSRQADGVEKGFYGISWMLTAYHVRRSASWVEGPPSLSAGTMRHTLRLNTGQYLHMSCIQSLLSTLLYSSLHLACRIRHRPFDHFPA